MPSLLLPAVSLGGPLSQRAELLAQELGVLRTSAAGHGAEQEALAESTAELVELREEKARWASEGAALQAELEAVRRELQVSSPSSCSLIHSLSLSLVWFVDSDVIPQELQEGGGAAKARIAELEAAAGESDSSQEQQKQQYRQLQEAHSALDTKYQQLKVRGAPAI